MADMAIKVNRILIYVITMAFFVSTAYSDNVAIVAFIIGVPALLLLANNLKEANLKTLNTINIKFLYVLPVCISLIYFFSYEANDIYLISFAAIFVLVCLLVYLPDKNNISNIANAWLIVGLINCLGIVAGLIEINFFNSNIFSKILYNTPYSNDQKNSVFGFLYNYNQAAYFLICSLALIDFQNIFSQKFTKFIKGLFLFSLFFTGSRVGLLYVLLVAILFLFFEKNNRAALSLIIGLCFSYVFLSNIIIASPDSYSIGSHHYRELIFSIFGYDFVLGTYGYFKVQAIDAILTNGFFPYGIQNFINQYGFVPHNMVIGNLLGGGYLFAISILLIFLILLKDFITIYKSGAYFFSISGIVSYFAETMNWDFSHAMYFWILLLLIPFIREKCS